MNVSMLLQWYELIFLLPLGLSALMLLLSSLRLGHHGGHAAHHGAAHLPAHVGGHGMGHHAPMANAPAHPASRHHAPGHHGPTQQTGHARHGSQNGGVKHGATPLTLIIWIVGAGRAPLPIMLEAFGLSWGVCGFLANAVFIPTAIIAPAGILPSLGVAAAGGVIGSRLAGELYARFMPKDETYVVSREGLFGLTGQVAFPVTETTGRVLIYDDHGTLHDEFCRVKPGGVEIKKGSQARIVDVDAQGRILVEEA